MKKITKTEWLKSVAKEIKTLKKSATKKEIDRLNFSKLRPISPTNCIYGQMTGDCYSDRAVELINQCCVKFTKNVDVLNNPTFQDTKKEINGKVVIRSGRRGRELDNTTHYLSSLEHYITLKGAKNKNVIDFLNGETSKLVL